jgi:DNA-binding transcriptional regulator YdaS (Cro superfamily)
MNTETPIARAVRLIGNQKDMAAKLNDFGLVDVRGERLEVSQQRISDWVRRGYPPAEMCLAIERLTEAQVTRHDLRPDVFSPEVDWNKQKSAGVAHG